MDVIGLRVFPLSLTGEAAIWFTKVALSFDLYLGAIEGCDPTTTLLGV